MAQSKPKIRIPDRKISETFLHFAEPLLEVLGPAATPAQGEQSLGLAFTVWNAVVYADATGNGFFLESLHQLTGRDPLVAALIARKRSLFGDDHRLIGEYKLLNQQGEMRLRVEARDPFTPA